MKKKHGPAWVLYEESIHKKQRRLVSILPSRRSVPWIQEYMTQLHVDTEASLAERLAYKRSPKSYPLCVQMGIHINPMSIGHDRILFAIHAKALVVWGNVLEFKYDILDKVLEDRIPQFRQVVQTIEVMEPWERGEPPTP